MLKKGLCARKVHIITILTGGSVCKMLFGRSQTDLLVGICNMRQKVAHCLPSRTDADTRTVIVGIYHRIQCFIFACVLFTITCLFACGIYTKKKNNHIEIIQNNFVEVNKILILRYIGSSKVGSIKNINFI